MPNAMQQANTKERLYAFFNTNEKIVHSNYTEDEWNSYFEAVIEPVAIQLGEEYSRKLFTRRERGFGNGIFLMHQPSMCKPFNQACAAGNGGPWGTDPE